MNVFSIGLLLISTIFLVGCIGTEPEMGPDHIEVMVYNELGDPIAGVDVYLDCEWKAGINSGGSKRSSITGPNGVATFSGHGGGFYIGTCKATASVGDIIKEVNVEVKKDMQPIEITLPISESPKSSLTGYVTYGTDPVEGAKVSIVISEGPIDGVLMNNPFISEDVTDSEGFYSFEELGPGTVSLSVMPPEDSSYESKRMTFSLSAAMDLRKDIDLS